MTNDSKNQSFRKAPLVTFSPCAYKCLRELDERTKPGMIMSVLWSSGGSSRDSDGALLAEYGPGLVVGWYVVEDVPVDLIVDFIGFKVVFAFPETDLQEIHIIARETNLNPNGLVIEGENPFLD